MKRILVLVIAVFCLTVTTGCLRTGGKGVSATPKKGQVTQEVMPTGPNADKELVAMGLREGERGDYVRAEMRFEQAATLNPYNADALFNLGVAQLRIGKARRAVDSFRRAQGLRPGEKKTTLLLGTALLNSGDTTGALAQFQAAQAIDPSNLEAKNGMAVAYIKMGNFTQAEAMLREILRENANFVDAHINMAILFLAQEKPGLSLQVLRTARKISPDNPSLESNLGYIWQVLGDQAKARAHYQKAIDLNQNQVEALGNLGALELKLKQIEKAYEHLSWAAQLAPGNPVVQNNYGAVLRVKGQFEQAEKAYKQAIESDPSRAESYHNIAILYADDMGRKDEAIQYFNLYKQYSLGKKDVNERVDKWIRDLQGVK